MRRVPLDHRDDDLYMAASNLIIYISLFDRIRASIKLIETGRPYRAPPSNS
jgi:hypothetical protein